MKRARKISVILLSISSFIGLLRGYRMIRYPAADSILFPYPENLIKDSVFSNYVILGWILFSLVGVFSLLVIASIHFNFKNYAYLIIIEGIFCSFLTLLHILLTGFVLVHLFVFPLCIVILVLGVLQTPKEF